MSVTTTRTSMLATVVVDSGGQIVRAGVAGKPDSLRIISNLISRYRNQTLVGDQVDSSQDRRDRTIRRPYDRGYCVDMRAQEEIWKRMFGPAILTLRNFSGTRVVVTEPFFNPKSVRDAMLRTLFGRFGFGEVALVNPLTMALLLCVKQPPLLLARYAGSKDFARPEGEESVFNIDGPAHLVLESGYSFSHVASFYEMLPILDTVRRVDVGGKLITNFLKDVLTFRQYDLSNETRLAEEVKKRLCYVSLDFPEEMKRCTLPIRPVGKDPSRDDFVSFNSIRRDFILPTSAGTDGRVVDPSSLVFCPPEGPSTQERLRLKELWSNLIAKQEESKDEPVPAGGFIAIQTFEQVLRMNVERITAPELLFAPSDIGIQQRGVVDAIWESVSAAHPYIRPLLVQNILLAGGNARFQNFAERIASDLRRLVPDDWEIRIFGHDDPQLSPYYGMSLSFASCATPAQCDVVTREQWLASTEKV